MDISGIKNIKTIEKIKTEIMFFANNNKIDIYLDLSRTFQLLKSVMNE